MPLRPHAFGHLDALERRYDGPIPHTDPALSRRPDKVARARLFERLAAEGRATVASRRARLPAPLAANDERLHDLSVTLALYREQGVSWRE